MIRSMFSAVSGLRTHQTRLDVVGNNISNVNTYGFKPGRATFKESIYQTTYGSSEGNDVYGGQNPSQVGYGSQIGGISLDFGVGNYEPTGFGTDCMIAGNGFFMVGPKLAAGANGILNTDDATNQLNSLNLTRVGAFTIDGEGYLVDENRNLVYGLALDDPGYATGTNPLPYAQDAVLKPIQIPAKQGETLPMKLESISIDGNGIISGKGDDGNIYKVGQIAICNVPNPNALEKIGDSYYRAVNNTGNLKAFKPGEGTTGKLMTGGLEMSKTDLSQEISNMIIAQRGLQANTRMITVSDEVLQELINMKR